MKIETNRNMGMVGWLNQISRPATAQEGQQASVDVSLDDDRAEAPTPSPTRQPVWPRVWPGL
jgi:hypothetical protein